MEAAKKKEKTNIRAGFRAVGRQLLPFRKELFFLSTLGLISAIANGVVPYVTGKFLDVLIDVAAGKVAVTNTLPLWLVLLGVWAFVQLIASGVDWILDRRNRSIETKIQLNMQSEGFVHLLLLPLSFHKNERIGEVVQKISQASYRISSILRTTTTIAPQLLSIIIGITLATTINATLALLLAFGVLCYLLLLLRILSPIAKLDETAHREWNETWGDAFAAVQQVESVKQAAAERYEIEKTRTSYLVKTYNLWNKLELIWSNVGFFQRVIIFGTQLAIFVLSVRYIAQGVITVGELVALNSYAAMFFGPFVQLGMSWQTIQNGLTTAAHVDEILTQKQEDYKHESGKALTPLHGAVTFSHTSFRYAPDQPTILSDIDFEVKPGEVVAFVGESGVGKSTTIGLLSGYYFPTDGSVQIDGIDTRELNLSVLRKQIAVVPQEVALFNDTIRTNIRYGTFDATDEEIIHAVKEAHLDEFIATLPQGYDTLVGERGVKLSVGQKQRIAIARAILRNPRILILDEPTSALDAKTEQFITASFERLMKGRTTFIIAHRLSTVRKADKIFVFEKGQIVERGTHQELLAIEGGVYRHLHEYQIGLH